ncbi:hypothetical protein HK102_001010 [Quaeritorhiza haematococci]|nr:hypothetical protein HK102_001010 [Quaeritorhiza haematococci]
MKGFKVGDTILNNCYKLVKVIGEGSYGKVFKALDTVTQTHVAVKLAKTSKSQLAKEFQVYQKLERRGTWPKVWEFQRLGDGTEILVMELLGKSLSSLKQPDETLVKSVMQQCIMLLADLHQIGEMVHQDLKPDNIVFGNSDRVHLINLGLSKPFSHYQEQCNLARTIRYTSINSHIGVHQSPRDDLISLGYVIIYVLTGSLPWQVPKTHKAQTKRARNETIMLKKMSTPIETVLEKVRPPTLHRALLEYMTMVTSLMYHKMPDYRDFRDLRYSSSGISRMYLAYESLQCRQVTGPTFQPMSAIAAAGAPLSFVCTKTNDSMGESVEERLKRLKEQRDVDIPAPPPPRHDAPIRSPEPVLAAVNGENGGVRTDPGETDPIGFQVPGQGVRSERKLASSLFELGIECMACPAPSTQCPKPQKWLVFTEKKREPYAFTASQLAKRKAPPFAPARFGQCVEGLSGDNFIATISRRNGKRQLVWRKANCIKGNFDTQSVMRYLKRHRLTSTLQVDEMDKDVMKAFLRLAADESYTVSFVDVEGTRAVVNVSPQLHTAGERPKDLDIDTKVGVLSRLKSLLSTPIQTDTVQLLREVIMNNQVVVWKQPSASDEPDADLRKKKVAALTLLRKVVGFYKDGSKQAFAKLESVLNELGSTVSTAPPSKTQVKEISAYAVVNSAEQKFADFCDFAAENSINVKELYEIK